MTKPLTRPTFYTDSSKSLSYFYGGPVGTTANRRVTRFDLIAQRAHVRSRASLRTTLLASLAGVLLTVGACRAPGTASSPRPVADDATRAVLAQEQRADLASSGTLGIPPFQWTGTDARLSALAFAMADLLVTDLAQSSQLQLVERGRLGDVLREIDLAGSGRVDSATAPRVGQLLGARRLILGTLDTLPNGDLRLSARVADVESGVLEQSFDARAPLTDLLAAEKVIAFRLFDALGVTLTPAERRAVGDAKPAASLDALTAYGRGVQAELSGDPRRAYDEYRRAIVMSPSFEMANLRANSVRQIVQSEATPGALMPGVRPINAAVSGTVDRLNRPLDLITTFARPAGGASDPAFPSTLITVIVQVRRP